GQPPSWRQITARDGVTDRVAQADRQRALPLPPSTECALDLVSHLRVQLCQLALELAWVRPSRFIACTARHRSRPHPGRWSRCCSAQWASWLSAVPFQPRTAPLLGRSPYSPP